MKKRFLLIAFAVVSCLCIKAQMVDVTAQYIPNAGFEECDALPTVVYHDNQKNIDIEKVELWSHWNTAKGTDYESTGWKLVEQMKNANGGVVTYGVNIQSGQYATAGEPGPSAGITGSKGLCFTGAAGLIYQQANEITLPAGTYRLTVNLYARNGQTTNPGPTQQVNNIKTGFMPTGGTEEELIPAKRNSMQFASNAWDQEVIDIELTQPMTGRFQISYGSSYYVVVDDVKLEYQGGVVTTALSNVIGKATTLNGQLNNSTLTEAIAAAQNFVDNPTSQDDVATQVETIYAAMATALAAAADPVDITAAYLENASFETGKIDPWIWESSTGTVGEPVNEASAPYIDGKNVMEFASTGVNTLSQTVGHLPAGYYVYDMKLNQKATLMLGSSQTQCQGGTDALYLRVSPSVLSFSGGDLKISTKASTAYRADNFRLFYGKDEASLQAILLQAVKADAQAILGDSQFDRVTGDERDDLLLALDGSDAKAINAAVSTFFNSKDAYDRLVKAKADAAPYTKENYPFAKAETLELIQTLIAQEALSRSMALEQTTQLNDACKSVVMENAYCEGVAHSDYTESIVAANANGTSLNAAWTATNMTIRSLSSSKALVGRDNAKDQTVYGTTDAYYGNGASSSASLQQTISGLPAGTYVFAASIMAKKDLPVNFRANNTRIAIYKGTGTTTSANWSEFVCSFEKEDSGNLIIRLDESTDMNYKEWYADNFRLFRLEPIADGIESITNGTSTKGEESMYFDLQGRRVMQPTKGLYIVGGKKVFLK